MNPIIKKIFINLNLYDRHKDKLFNNHLRYFYPFYRFNLFYFTELAATLHGPIIFVDK